MLSIMHILFLGDPENPLVDFLRSKEDKVTATMDKITPDYCKTNNIDYVVSYNYKHLVRKNVLDMFPNKIINLHISYLPYNRGMHPNVWSFVEGTPKGVTIHVMEEGLDTGDILVQKEVDFGDLEEQTLTSTYAILQSEIQQLFMNNWESIRNDTVTRVVQDHNKMTFHYGKELKTLDQLLSVKGWETPILDLINQSKKTEKTEKTESGLSHDMS